jgi:hypothetical protein
MFEYEPDYVYIYLVHELKLRIYWMNLDKDRLKLRLFC